MTDTDSGWRKRQIALDIKAENARELGLDYEPVHPTQRQWVGLTRKEVYDLYDSDFETFHQRIEAALRSKNEH